MAMNDPISDMLTRIRNANMANQEFTDIPASKIKGEIARVLKNEGYIEDYKVEEIDKTKKQIRVYLKTNLPSNVIHGLKRVSKVGRREFVKVDKIPRVIGGLGITILSTSKGIMTDRQARKERLGGEVLAMVW